MKRLRGERRERTSRNQGSFCSFFEKSIVVSLYLILTPDVINSIITINQD